MIGHPPPHLRRLMWHYCTSGACLLKRMAAASDESLLAYVLNVSWAKLRPDQIMRTAGRCMAARTGIKARCYR